jgi:hypothetical protein
MSFDKKRSTAELTTSEDYETLHSEGEAEGQGGDGEGDEDEVEEELPTDAIEWKIEGISKSKKERLYSDTKVTGDCKWRIMVFPRGNKAPDHFSAYVEIANAKDLKPGWSYNAFFSLELVNSKDPVDTFHHSKDHPPTHYCYSLHERSPLFFSR